MGSIAFFTLIMEGSDLKETGNGLNEFSFFPLYFFI